MPADRGDRMISGQVPAPGNSRTCVNPVFWSHTCTISAPPPPTPRPGPSRHAVRWRLPPRFARWAAAPPLRSGLPPRTAVRVGSDAPAMRVDQRPRIGVASMMPVCDTRTAITARAENPTTSTNNRANRDDDTAASSETSRQLTNHQHHTGTATTDRNTTRTNSTRPHPTHANGPAPELARVVHVAAQQRRSSRRAGVSDTKSRYGVLGGVCL